MFQSLDLMSTDDGEGEWPRMLFHPRKRGNGSSFDQFCCHRKLGSHFAQLHSDQPLDGCKQSPLLRSQGCSLSKTAMIELLPLSKAPSSLSLAQSARGTTPKHRRLDGLAEMHCLTNITIGSSFTIYELCDLVHLRHLSPLQFLIGKNLNKFIFKTWDSYFKINFPKVSFTYNKCTHFSIKFDDF